MGPKQESQPALFYELLHCPELFDAVIYGKTVRYIVAVTDQNEKKPIAFITMVRDDNDMLNKWINHHAELTGDRKSLYVIVHGGNDEIIEIANGCSVISIPFDPSGTSFESKRMAMMRGFADGLFGYFEKVCILDCDEFIVVNPDFKMPFLEMLATQFDGLKAISPLGFEIVHHLAEEKAGCDFDQTILSQRPHGFFSAMYCKPCILTEPNLRGNVHRLNNAPWSITDKIFLIHLKWMDIDFVSKTSDLRDEVMQIYKVDKDKIELGGWDARTEIGGWPNVDEMFANFQKLFEGGVEPLPEGEALAWYPRRFERALKRRGRVPKMVFGPFKLPKRFEKLL